ncbi:unnamed protein product [Cryptosporidium hominis]|uniref:Uncharacterized protein n=1 Tax=Cryptosporidium hominis TaxID=237895 RepID=A0A0S4THE6_CRYHO|nr:multi-pass transmembrane protein [Cryptosporidium hominis TU502]OLQ19021.1 putative integral membrane protein [Cryptosporidium hominis]PPA62674.1 hypothetical protein ChUKH1_11975 [Cryptosporidium hominis]CUV06862.1 unnamed protein product [Cryptosporidium hominis]
MAKKKGKLDLNIAALTASVGSMVLLMMSIFLSSWLYNAAGKGFYPYPRYWGLLTVIGRRTQSHNEVWEIACITAGKLALGLTCSSPLCIWYSHKCDAYRIVKNISYATAIVLAITCGMLTGAMICSLRSNISSLRLSTAFSFAAFLICSLTLCLYAFLMNEAFGIINSVGYYPVPQPSVSFAIALGGIFLLLVAFIAYAQRYRKLRAEKDFEEDTWYEYQNLKNEYYGYNAMNDY